MALLTRIALIPLLALLTIGSSRSEAGWDKPFDKGGPLNPGEPKIPEPKIPESWKKPFDHGGALSVGKIHVPKKLRIGKVKTVAEVLIPVCWGSPQDCREKPKEVDGEGMDEVKKSYPYYIFGNFQCRDKDSGKVVGSCLVIMSSSNSCEEALQSLASRPETDGDPCVYCNPNITNHNVYWDGDAPHTQDGPCAGM